MNKREFIKNSGLLVVGSCLGGSALSSCMAGKNSQNNNLKVNDIIIELPVRNFDYHDFEPIIDRLTMDIHFNKHHGGYVTKFNKGLLEWSGDKSSVRSILEQIKDIDSDEVLRNNGGGHFNHSMFWSILSKQNKANMPSSSFVKVINNSYNDFESFKQEFSNIGKTVFGSGWVWLCKDKKSNKLKIIKSINQDNPLMINIYEKKLEPVLCLDVWEHAYYLSYQNKRADYINGFFELIDWKKVEQYYEEGFNI